MHNVKVQHPCFTTTAHEIGQKKPQAVDMPVKWGGKEVSRKQRRQPAESATNQLPAATEYNPPPCGPELRLDFIVLDLQGNFTQDFIMQEPGKASISINA